MLSARQWLVLVVMTISSSLTIANETESKLQDIERQIAELKLKLAEMEDTNHSETSKQGDIKLYSTLRPTFGLIDDGNSEYSDVRDALSHAGFKSTKNLGNGWQGIMHGEWGIDLANNGDFGKARQVYVALDSPYGRVGIGKQRPAQYLFIAEYVDLFNHSSSPFAYDPESLFFVNNLLTYQKKFGAFNFIFVSQYDGEAGSNYEDLINTGFSYDENGLHIAFTYTEQDALQDEQLIGSDDIIAVSIAYEFTEQLYGAIGYQDKDYSRNIADSRNGHTLDISFAYKINQFYKVKLGYFEFDDGISSPISNQYSGSNVTLEWLPVDNIRIHAEYLFKGYEQQEDFSSVSIGFRYDFAQTWPY